MTTRTVYGTVLQPDDTPWAGGVVKFILSPGSYNGGSHYPAAGLRVRTDADGEFELDLWANGEGDAISRYVVTFPSGEEHTFSFPLGDGSPVELSTLLALGLTITDPGFDTVLDYLASQPQFVGAAAVAIESDARAVAIAAEAAARDAAIAAEADARDAALSAEASARTDALAVVDSTVAGISSVASAAQSAAATAVSASQTAENIANQAALDAAAARVAAESGTGPGFATRALLFADLAYAAGTIGMVTNDPTPAYNGTYLKSGASGTGSWTQSSYDRVAQLETRTDDIEELVEERTAAMEQAAALMISTLGGYGVRKGVPYWTPLAVMLRGEQGAWFDFGDTSTLFADVGFTTPAELGDPVLGILDKSGNGHNITQSNSALAATLERDVQGIYYLQFPSSTCFYTSTTGGQWATFSMFAALRPSTIPGVSRTIYSARSAANVGVAVLHLATARLFVGSGSGNVTVTPEFPRPLLTAGGFSVVGAIHDGTNGLVYADTFRGLPAAATHAVNASPGFRIGAEKYFTPSTNTYAGAMYGLFVVNRAVTVEEAEQAVAGLSVFQEGINSNALSAARAAIEAAAGDVNILVIGDSTGDSKLEWVYKATTALAQMYPRHAFSYRRFDFATNAYETAELIQAGDNGHTVRIWNSSISLSVPGQVTGDRYATSVEGIPAPALVVWNHGHNIAYAAKPAEKRGEYLSAMEQVRLTWPNAHHAALLQNPLRDSAEQEVRYEVLRGIVVDRPDLLLIDTRAKFEALAKAPGLYTDNIHPAPPGSDLQRDAFMEAWRAAIAATPAAVSAPWLNTTATNLLTNGDFAAYSGATPDSWTLIGTPTLTKDTTIKDGADAYSLKVENASAAIQGVSQALDSGVVTGLRGTNLTIAVRLRANSTWARSGVFQVYVTGTAGGTVIYDPVSEGEPGGAFRWSIISEIPVPSDATAISVRLLGTNSTTSGAYTHYARAVLVSGDIPRDMP